MNQKKKKKKKIKNKFIFRYDPLIDLIYVRTYYKSIKNTFDLEIMLFH